MKNKSIIGNLMLLVTAFIWGSAFVAQSVGMEYVKPLTFNGIRSMMAGIALIPVTAISDSLKYRKTGSYGYGDGTVRNTLFSGFICGIFLFIASTIQNYGISMTTVGKAGFLSVLYILFVPIIQIVFRKPLPRMLKFALPLALAGMYLLTMTSGFGSVNNGDLLTIVSSFCYAMHIIVIDHFSPKVNPIKLSCLQFLTSGTLGMTLMFIVDKPDFQTVVSAWLPICYAGLLSGGVAYTLQVVAQKYTVPSIASLFMSFESVFALLSGAVILKQIPTPREAFGCVLMFSSIMTVQFGELIFNKLKQKPE